MITVTTCSIESHPNENNSTSTLVHIPKLDTPTSSPRSTPPNERDCESGNKKRPVSKVAHPKLATRNRTNSVIAPTSHVQSAGTNPVVLYLFLAAGIISPAVSVVLSLLAVVSILLTLATEPKTDVGRVLQPVSGLFVNGRPGVGHVLRTSCDAILWLGIGRHKELWWGS